MAKQIAITAQATSLKGVICMDISRETTICGPSIIPGLWTAVTMTAPAASPHIPYLTGDMSRLLERRLP